MKTCDYLCYYPESYWNSNKKNKTHINHNHKENRWEDSAGEINKQKFERSTVDRKWVNGLEHKELKPK